MVPAVRQNCVKLRPSCPSRTCAIKLNRSLSSDLDQLREILKITGTPGVDFVAKLKSQDVRQGSLVAQRVEIKKTIYILLWQKNIWWINWFHLGNHDLNNRKQGYIEEYSSLLKDSSKHNLPLPFWPGQELHQKFTKSAQERLEVDLFQSKLGWYIKKIKILSPHLAHFCSLNVYLCVCIPAMQPCLSWRRCCCWTPSRGWVPQMPWTCPSSASTGTATMRLRRSPTTRRWTTWTWHWISGNVRWHRPSLFFILEPVQFHLPSQKKNK